jgi:hypothetical protein
MDDKQAWHAAAAEYDKIKAFLDRPRCINCDNYLNGVCEHYGPVPEEHWYTPNDCDKWEANLPF